MKRGSKDPGKAKGDGMMGAMRGEHKKSSPMKPSDPGKAKGDGLKSAMRDQGKKPSKLSPMGAAKMKVR